MKFTGCVLTGEGDKMQIQNTCDENNSMNFTGWKYNITTSRIIGCADISLNFDYLLTLDLELELELLALLDCSQFTT